MENKELKSEIKELLNTIAIKLKDVSHPDLEESDDGDYNNIPMRLRTGTDRLQIIKVIIEAALNDIDNNNNYGGETSKMARAYYSSFCNA